MSLVSRSDRSGLRSLVQAAVRFKVSLCAQKSSALHHNQALLITRCLLRLRFPPSSSSSSSSTLHPLRFCTMLHCLALGTAEVSHFFTASFVWLVLPQRGRHQFCFFSPFFCLVFQSLAPFISLFPGNSQIFTISEHHCVFVYIVICRDSPRLLRLESATCVVIYKLYIWRIASQPAMRSRPLSLTSVPLSFLHHSQRAVLHPRWVARKMLTPIIITTSGRPPASSFPMTRPSSTLNYKFKG